jgi:PST family polysaccharide transporter
MTGSIAIKSRLMANFFSLSTVQVVNYIVPLITVPYLLRTIGTEKYGLFAFASAFVAYFQVLFDYGFNLTGVRDISQNRYNHPALSRILSEIFSAKFLLFLLLSFLAIPMIHFIQRFNNDAHVYYWAYINGVGSCLFPVWFFQGIEQMAILATLNIASKVLYLLLMFIFIRNPENFMNLLYIAAFCSWLVTAIGIGLVAIKFPLRITLRGAIAALRSGFGIFTTQIWAAILASSNTFVLGLFSSNKEVGIYAVAEKIVKAAICLGVPLCVAIYPRSGVLFKQSANTALCFLKKVMWMGGTYMVLVSILLFSLAPVVADLIVGHHEPDVAVLIRILAILPFTVFIDNIYGTQILLNIGREKQVVHVMGISAALSILFLIFLVPLFGSRGTAFSYLFSAMLVLLLMGIALWRTGVSPFLTIRNRNVL